MTNGAPDAEGTLRVHSDVGPLRRVLVHAPGPETCKVITVQGNDDGPMLVPDLMGEGAAGEHESLVRRLRESGAEVLLLSELLDEAVAEAREAGALAAWLHAHFPALASHASRIDAAALLGAADWVVYREGGEGRPGPLAEPLNGAFYTRDPAVVTPRGLVLCHFVNRDRAKEPALLRLVLEWSPRLRGMPIAFDAAREDVFLQGGDLIVVDEETLLLGVGHRSDPAAAPVLARALEMDVIAVRMPRARTGAANGLRTLFLHLDTVFNLVGHDRVLAVPYFLEAEHAGRDPLTRLLRGASGIEPEEASRLARELEVVGRLARHRAGSGEADDSLDGMKLVDWAHARGMDVVHVGGEVPEGAETKHLAEVVLRELRFQAANVVATAPGELLAYEGNEATLRALRDRGVSVTTFPGEHLARWHGGPHCMTLPLERG